MLSVVDMRKSSDQCWTVGVLDPALVRAGGRTLFLCLEIRADRFNKNTESGQTGDRRGWSIINMGLLFVMIIIHVIFQGSPI